MTIFFEKFLKIVFNNYNWKIGKIQINSFVTTDGMNEITTWTNVLYDEEHKVYYKYKEMLDKAYDGLNKFNNGYKWSYVLEDGIDKIKLIN